MKEKENNITHDRRKNKSMDLLSPLLCNIKKGLIAQIMEKHLGIPHELLANCFILCLVLVESPLVKRCSSFITPQSGCVNTGALSSVKSGCQTTARFAKQLHH